MLAMALTGAFGWFVVTNEHIEGVRSNSGHAGGILDYVAFHAAARLVWEGEGDRIYDLEVVGEVETETLNKPIHGQWVLPYLNPPFVALALAPLGGLDLSLFLLALVALNLVLFLLTAVLVERMLALHNRRERIFYWLLSLSAYPVCALFLQQQFTLWVCLAWVGLVWFETRGNHSWAGASLALGLVKPQMILLPLLFLAYQRRWKTLGWFTAVAVPLVVASIAVVGLDGVLDYPRFLLASTTWEGNGVNARQMYGWNGLVADITGDPSPAKPVLIALALLTLAVVAWSWRANRSTQLEQLPGVMALALMGTILVNPHLYLYDMTLASLALAFALVQAKRQSGSLGHWPLVAVVLWVSQLPLPGAEYDRGFPLLSLASVALFAFLCVSNFAHRRQSPVIESIPVPTRLAA
jgi:hypothetical protein